MVSRGGVKQGIGQGMKRKIRAIRAGDIRAEESKVSGKCEVWGCGEGVGALQSSPAWPI